MTPTSRAAHITAEAQNGTGEAVKELNLALVALSHDLNQSLASKLLQDAHVMIGQAQFAIGRSVSHA